MEIILGIIRETPTAAPLNRQQVISTCTINTPMMSKMLNTSTSRDIMKHPRPQLLVSELWTILQAHLNVTANINQDKKDKKR